MQKWKNTFLLKSDVQMYTHELFDTVPWCSQVNARNVFFVWLKLALIIFWGYVKLYLHMSEENSS